MKSKILSLFILCSLFFNVAHAAIIATNDDCDHQTVHEYVSEQSVSSECGDLCDMHHLFHFMAILTNTEPQIETLLQVEKLPLEKTVYTSFFREKNIKPPIA